MDELKIYTLQAGQVQAVITNLGARIMRLLVGGTDVPTNPTKAKGHPKGLAFLLSIQYRIVDFFQRYIICLNITYANTANTMARNTKKTLRSFLPEFHT